MARKEKAKPRPAERDYSHRALLDKLGVKPGHRVAVVDIPDADFLRDLTGRVPNFAKTASGGSDEGWDLIFLGAESKDDLPRVKSLAGKLQKAGAIWIVYPKAQSQIREADVFSAGKGAGLTDNKVCRFSESHTALRFVIPAAKR